MLLVCLVRMGCGVELVRKFGHLLFHVVNGVVTFIVYVLDGLRAISRVGIGGYTKNDQDKHGDYAGRSSRTHAETSAERQIPIPSAQRFESRIKIVCFPTKLLRVC